MEQEIKLIDTKILENVFRGVETTEVRTVARNSLDQLRSELGRVKVLVGSCALPNKWGVSSIGLWSGVV